RAGRRRWRILRSMYAWSTPRCNAAAKATRQQAAQRFPISGSGRTLPEGTRFGPCFPDSRTRCMPAVSGARLLPWLSLLAIWIVWSSTYLGMAAAVETIPPFTMTASRFLLAAPILLATGIPAWRRGTLQLRGPQVRSAALIGVMMLLGGPGLVGLGVTELDSSLAALIVAMTPIWLSIFSAIQTRTVPKAGVFGALVTGLIGIGIMVGGPGGNVPIAPALLVLVSTLFWS